MFNHRIPTPESDEYLYLESPLLTILTLYTTCIMFYITFYVPTVNVRNTYDST